MCGIIGTVTHSATSSRFDQLRDLLRQRGPDDKGTYTDDRVTLGHRRLSILDLDGGQQPMFSQGKEAVIVYNGEIYNFLTLRKELQKAGVTFFSRSDTEVLLQGYLKYGIDGLLEKIEGMFAFALHDIRTDHTFIVRDRYGEKPLFYTKNDEGFFFASELKALDSYYSKEKLSKSAINLFFSLTYIPAPYTIYQDVFKLEPGKYIEIDREGEVKLHDYYDLKSVVHKSRKDLITDYASAQRELKDLLFHSVEKRMIADVPLGSFLSGGIDSSIVSAIMAKKSKAPIKTFSIGFKEKAYDESQRAELVAKHIGSDHTLHVLGHEDLLRVVDETLAYFDEPFGDSSAIPSMMVAKKAREKVKVVLTGDCADELFGGYEKYLGKYYAEKYNRIPSFVRNLFEKGIKFTPHTQLTNQLLRKVKKVINSAGLDAASRYLNLTSLGFSQDEKDRLFQTYTADSSPLILRYFNELPEEDELTRTFYSDIKLVLEGDMLTKVDRACMMHSLEARIPFLDSRIVGFSFRLPHDFKIQGSNKKKILKDTFEDLLPRKTMTFGKKGFGIPLQKWFRDELKADLLSLLDADFIASQGIFNLEYIQQLLNEHFERKENHASRLWLLFVFQKWYKRNIS